MPTLINGCGTRYAGRKNLATRQGICKSCGRTGTLSSYDTRLCLTLLFIPLIPISKKRIIDECPHCRKHYAIKLHEWETRRQLGISGGLEEFRMDRTVEKGMAAHAAMVGFREFQQADELRKELESCYPDSTRLQLYLAETDYEHGRSERADAAVRKAFTLTPELPQARLAMASVLRREGKLDEARRLLDMLEKPGAAGTYPLGELEMLALAYQKASRHQEARTLLLHLLRELPSIGQNPVFRKNLLNSEKALAIPSSALPKRDRSVKALMSEKKSRTLMLCGLAAALIAGGMVARNEYVRRHRVVTVVNGLPQAVTVTLDDGGQSVTVSPGARGVLTVKEGRHHASVTGAVTEIIDFTVESGYTDRWTKSPAFVLNPSGEVPLEFIRAVYSKDSPVPEVTYTVGRQFAHYEDVDHLFEPLPGTVRMKRSQKRTLTSLNRAKDDIGGIVAYMGVNQGNAEAMDAAESVLGRHPENESVLEAYSGQVRNEATETRALAFLAKGLERRPLSMPLARAWQDLHQTPEAKQEMLTVTEKMAAAEPGNADLLYLQGRAMPDGPESAAVFEKAGKLAPENPWPPFALGYLLMEQGKWRESRELFAKAAALAPGQKQFTALLTEARLGCGEGAAIAQELAKGPTGDPSVQFARLRALAAAGDVTHGEMVRRSLMDTLTNRGADADVIHSLTNQWLYMSRQFAELAKRNNTSKAAPARESRVWLALQNGDLAAAEKDIGVSRTNTSNSTLLDNPVLHLAVWVAAGMAGDELRLAAAQAVVTKDLKDGFGTGAEALITQKSDVTQEQLDSVYLHPLMKGLFCAGLIHSHPGQKEFLAAQASLYNVDPRFPSALIDKAIGKPVITP